MNIEQALENAYTDIAKSATDPTTNFSQNMKAMFERQDRERAWNKAVHSSGLESIRPNAFVSSLGNQFVNGEITISEAIDLYKRNINITPEEEVRRRNAWERAVVSSALEGLERDPKHDEYMEAYFKGERTEEDTSKGLEAMIRAKYILTYPATFTKDEEGYLVRFRDVPEAITYGYSYAEAVDMAQDVLETAFSIYADDLKKPFPFPSKTLDDEILITLPFELSEKIKVHNWRLHKL